MSIIVHETRTNPKGTCTFLRENDSKEARPLVQQALYCPYRQRVAMFPS